MTTRTAFRAGFVEAVPVAISFFFLFLAVGAVSASAGLGSMQATVMTILIFAAPAQLVIAEMVTHQNWWAATFMTVVINFRFAVMAAALLPFFTSVPKGRLLAGLSMLSASTFGVSFLKFRHEVEEKTDFKPFDYYLGVSAIAFSSAIVSTAIGYHLATRINASMSDIIKMILPVYFTTMLAKEWGKTKLLAAAGLGFVATSVTEALIPNFGLIISALVVGTVLSRLDRQEARNV